MNLTGRGPLSLMVALLTGLMLLAGCASPLCTKHLFLFRDTEQKQPTAQLALLLTDPGLANAVLAQPLPPAETGCQWAPEQAAYEGEVYRLSMDKIDDKPVYQGLCLDTLFTYACEVRPGRRRVLVRCDRFGPWGQEKVKQTVPLTLEAGRCYFLQPDCAAMKDQGLVLKVEPLPDAYTPQLRARLVDYKRRYMKGME